MHKYTQLYISIHKYTQVYYTTVQNLPANFREKTIPNKNVHIFDKLCEVS